MDFRSTENQKLKWCLINCLGINMARDRKQNYWYGILIILC